MRRMSLLSTSMPCHLRVNQVSLKKCIWIVLDPMYSTVLGSLHLWSAVEDAILSTHSIDDERTILEGMLSKRVTKKYLTKLNHVSSCNRSLISRIASHTIFSYETLVYLLSHGWLKIIHAFPESMTLDKPCRLLLRLLWAGKAGSWYRSRIASLRFMKWHLSRFFFEMSRLVSSCNVWIWD